MSETVIRVENLGKKYIIGHQKQERYTSLRDVITDKVKSFGQVLKWVRVVQLSPELKVYFKSKDKIQYSKIISKLIVKTPRIGIIT
jgi:hypothetical protein